MRPFSSGDYTPKAALLDGNGGLRGVRLGGAARVVVGGRDVDGDYNAALHGLRHMQHAVVIDVGGCGELVCVGAAQRGQLVGAGIGCDLNRGSVGVGQRASELGGQLNGSARFDGCRGRRDGDPRHGLRNDGAARDVGGGEHDSGDERRDGIDAPVVQEIVVAEGLGIVNGIRLIEGIAATEEIDGGQKGDAIVVGERELVDDNLSRRNFGLLEMEQRREGVHVHGCGNLGRDQKNKLARLCENGKVLKPNAVVLRARELKQVGVGADCLKELAPGSLVGRGSGKMVLVETDVLLVECDELHHDAVLVVVVGVNRYLHDRGNIVGDSGCAVEGRHKLMPHDGDIVTVAAVLRVVPDGVLGALHLENVLSVVDVGVRLYPSGGNFLLGGAVEHLRGLEPRKRVAPLLRVDVGRADSVHENIDELVPVSAVHGVEERGLRGCDAGLRGLRDSLLVVVGCVQPDGIEDGCVVVSHFCLLTFNRN